MNIPDFKKIQSELDGAGYVTEIRKVGRGQFNLIINWEITELRKSRITLKRRIIALYNVVFGTCLCEWCGKKDQLLIFKPELDSHVCEECLSVEEMAA